MMISFDDAPRFRTTVASNREREAYLAMMNEAYRQQVRGLEEQRMIELSRKFHGHVELSEEQLQSTLEHYEGQHLRYCNAVQGRPVLAVLGSARNAAVTPYGIALMRALAQASVKRSLGVSTGDWFMGYMGVSKYFWLKEKLKYDRDWAYSTAVPLAGQEMQEESFCAATRPEWFTTLCAEQQCNADDEWQSFTHDWKEERRSPPHATFLSRTLNIYFPPQACGKVYCKPGMGTKEEYQRLRLARQMAGRNITVDSWRPEGSIPWDFILDEPRRDGLGWCWDFLLKETQMQVQEGTVGIDELQGQAIVRVCEEKQVSSLQGVFTEHWVDDESSLLTTLAASEETQQPLIVQCASYELAAQFVVQRSYLTHRRLREALAADLLKENGSAADSAH